MTEGDRPPRGDGERYRPRGDGDYRRRDDRPAGEKKEGAAGDWRPEFVSILHFDAARVFY